MLVTVYINLFREKKKSCQLEVVQEQVRTTGTRDRTSTKTLVMIPHVGLGKNPDKDLLRRSSDRILRGDSTNIDYITVNKWRFNHLSSMPVLVRGHLVVDFSSLKETTKKESPVYFNCLDKVRAELPSGLTSYFSFATVSSNTRATLSSLLTNGNGNNNTIYRQTHNLLCAQHNSLSVEGLFFLQVLSCVSCNWHVFVCLFIYIHTRRHCADFVVFANAAEMPPLVNLGLTQILARICAFSSFVKTHSCRNPVEMTKNDNNTQAQKQKEPAKCLMCADGMLQCSS